jgi:hypothetical protein
MEQVLQETVPCANSVLVVTAYFVDAVEARLKQEFELATRLALSMFELLNRKLTVLGNQPTCRQYGLSPRASSSGG